MLKKLFVTAAAAAAVSVPLAGVAWADPPSDNNPPGQGPTGPGVPRQAGAYLDSVDANGPKEPDVNPNGYGNPLTPGTLFNAAKDAVPGVSTPDAIGPFVDGFYLATQGLVTDFGSTPPGMAVKTLTPGCKSGHTADSNNAVVGSGICH